MVSLSGNKTAKISTYSISEFVILKSFKIDLRPRKTSSPLINWIKANTDGAMVQNPTIAACGGLFRDYNSNFIGGFAQNLDSDSSFVAELLAAAIMAIEIAHSKGWHNLWLETDSQLALVAFKLKTMIPWELRNRWIISTV